MAPELSVCIPTWNRAPYLALLLDSLLPQATDEVEVVVSDNGSDDDTERVVEAYRPRFPRLVYHRWERNMGADRNYLKSVEVASGKYCWLSGSDDLAAPGAVERILRRARAGEHEIYLSDPGRTAPERLKTALRYAVRPVVS